MIIGLVKTFDAAHFIPGHEKCGNMHGHTYTVEVQLSGPIHKKECMVMDFGNFKRILSHYLDKWDHTTLNDSITIPTAENIAYELAISLTKELEELKSSAQVRSVRVWETPTSYAEWRNNGCR